MRAVVQSVQALFQFLSDFFLRFTGDGTLDLLTSRRIVTLGVTFLPVSVCFTIVGRFYFTDAAGAVGTALCCTTRNDASPLRRRAECTMVNGALCARLCVATVNIAGSSAKV